MQSQNNRQQGVVIQLRPINHVHRLHRLRQHEGVGLERFAEMIGVDLETLKAWETYREPVPVKHWTQLAALFEVSVEYLLGLDRLNARVA